MPKPVKSAKGWRPKGATRRIEPNPQVWPQLAADEGEIGLWAEVRDDLTFAQINAIPFGGDVVWRNAWEAIAPYVIDWNAEGLDVETGDYAPLPPPAQAGPEVFEQTPKAVTTWLVLELKMGPLRGPDPKGLKRSDDTDAISNASA